MTDRCLTSEFRPPVHTWAGRLLVAGWLVGTAMRLWFFHDQPAERYAVDRLFDQLGWHLAQGLGFTLDGDTPSAHVGPLYPAVLAVFYALAGHRPEWVPYLHLAVDALASLFVFFAGRHFLGDRAAALAAAAVYLYPAYWTYDLRIRSESLLTCLVAAWLWVGALAGRSDRSWLFAAAGLLGGLTVLCKPVFLPAALLLLWWPIVASRTWRIGLARTGLYVGCLLLVLLPWTIRNYQAFQVWVPVSTGVGVGLWTGSDPVSKGSWPMPLPVEAQIWETAGIAPLPYAHVMYEVPQDRALFRKGLARILDAPGRYLRLVAARVGHLWIGNDFYLLNGHSSVIAGLQRDVAERGWWMAGYSLLKRWVLIPAAIVLAGIGAWRSRASWRLLFPLYALPIGLTLGYVPFVSEAGRYILPVLPCMFLLAARVLVDGTGSLSGPHRQGGANSSPA